MTESATLEQEILSLECRDCNKGRYHRVETEIEFRRVYDHVITIEFHVSGVPALVCEQCSKELILPEVENKLWEQFRLIENSQEFKNLVETQKELLRRTAIKQSTQSIELMYAP